MPRLNIKSFSPILLPLKSLGRILSKALAFFTKFSSRVYGLSYLALIPIYAFIYLTMPGHFYHSTVPYEYSIRREKDEISQELQRQIIATFISVHGTGQIELSNGWGISTTSFNVRSLKVEGDKMSFMLDLELSNATQSDRRIHTAPIIEFKLMDWSEDVSAEDVLNDDARILYRPITFISPGLLSDDPATMKFAKTLFPASGIKMNIWQEVFNLQKEKETVEKLVMPLSRRLNNKILDLARGTGGDPSKLRGNFSGWCT